MTLKIRVLLVLFLAPVFTSLHTSPAQKPQAPNLASIYAALTGSWTGALEYRDYQSNEHVKLPAWLEITATSDSRTLDFHYIYDDGPSKTVEEISRVELNLDQKLFIETSSDNKSKETYQLSGFDKLSPQGLGALILTGPGVENDKKVDVRITLKIGRNYYRYMKETRLPGADFQFRDAYDFTRRNPPGGPSQSR